MNHKASWEIVKRSETEVIEICCEIQNLECPCCRVMKTKVEEVNWRSFFGSAESPTTMDYGL